MYINKVDRAAALPRLEFGTPWLDSKDGLKKRATSPRGKLKGEQHKQQQEQHEQRLRRVLSPSRESVLYCTGQRLFMGSTLYSSAEPPEGQVQGGKPTQPYQTSGNTGRLLS